MILLVVNFLLVGLLPVIFFRRDGKFNFNWFLTAIPFLLASIVIVLAWTNLLETALPQSSLLLKFIQLMAIPVSVSSVTLLSMTVGVHRIPLALWHQDNDDAVELVTWGTYSKIRHPFYSSFLLYFLAVILAFPHWLTVGLFVYSATALSITARREERRLKASEFGGKYVEYMKSTGRFFPPLQNISRD